MKLLPLLLILFVLLACGGGNEPIASAPTPSIKAIAPVPVKKATTVTGGNAVVIHLYQALYGMAPSNALLIDYAFQANNDASLFAKNLTDRFATTSHADLAKLVLDNLGVTPTTVPAVNTKGESEYALLQDAVKQLFAGYPTMRGQVVLNMTNLLAGLESDVTYGAAAMAFNAQGTSNFKNTATYSVPTDTARISYPANYQTATTLVSDLNVDPCNLDLSVVTYPQNWQGKFALPTVLGAPIDASFGRGVMLKDIMLHDNPAFILNGAPNAPNGCKGNLQSEFLKTIAKLKSLGVDHVYVPQWHWASKNADGSWYIMKSENSFGPLSDADLTFFVQAAHAAGMKVIMMNQIQGMMEDPAAGAYVPPATLENFQKWFSAFQPFMVERSKFFQGLGIDMWEVGCSACIYRDDGDGSVETGKLFADEYTKTLVNIKQEYKGKIIFSGGGWFWGRPDFIDKIDIIGVGFWTPAFTAEQSASLSVESYKAALVASGTVSSLQYVDRIGKTMLMNITIQSRGDALTNPGYVEETACTAALGDLNVSTGTCMQRDTPTDFSLQAIVYEAIFETIKENSFKVSPIVMIGDYWETDSLIPQTAFPNIAASFRNKPAEGVVKRWYAK